MATYLADPDGTIGVDGVTHLSLSAAASIAGDNDTINCQSSGGSADTTAASFGVSAGDNLIIQAVSGHEAIKTGWSSSRYRLSVNGNALTFGFFSLSPTVIGLQVETTSTSYGAIAVNHNVGGGGTSNAVFNGCRIRKNSGSGNSQSGISRSGGTVAGSSIKVFNTIVSGFSTTVSLGISIGSADFTNYVYQSVAYNNSTGIKVSATDTVKNSASFNSADDINGAATIDYCATDDGDGTNSVSPSGSDWDNEFSGPSTGDWTLLDTGNLYQGGVALSGGPATDIDGDSWLSPPSVGIDEFVSAGGMTGKANPLYGPFGGPFYGTIG